MTDKLFVLQSNVSAQLIKFSIKQKLSHYSEVTFCGNFTNSKYLTWCRYFSKHQYDSEIV